MATGMVQLNTRLDAELKRGGDAVFARMGLKVSDVVRAVWQYAVKYQTAPDCVLQAAQHAEASERERAIDLARSGCGLAVVCAMGGAESHPLGSDAVPLALDLPDWQTLRDEMYDDILEEMDARCQ